MNKNTIKVLSLFSGCGGLDLGFEQVGDYKTVLLLIEQALSVFFNVNYI